MKQIFNNIQVLFAVLLSTNIQAQDVLFSAPDNTQLAINPAQAGSYNKLQANVGYRNQWQRLGNPFNTMMASIDVTLEGTRKSYLAIGLEFYSDNSSSKIATTMVRSSWAYHLQLNSYNRLSVGMNFGVIGLNSNLENERWGNQYDGTQYNSNLFSGESYMTSNITKMDVGGGIVFSSKNSIHLSTPTFQCGIAGYHLNRPNLSMYSISNSKLPIRISSFINFSVPFNEGRNEIKPAAYFQIQGKFLSYLAGSMLTFNGHKHKAYNMYNAKNGTSSFSMGLFYRSTGAVVTRVSIQKSAWDFGFTFDMNIRNKTNVMITKGASEISLKYSIGK
ncbi:MAG: PorP/SprF family type IX secretion system membrane protein [Flavobacteriia bacterium]|nr:PorP/SprF family type IX secretion system membrane protein [Flavobacteriia bacterium]